MRGGWRRWSLWGLWGGGAGCGTEVVSVALVKGEGGLPFWWMMVGLVIRVWFAGELQLQWE